METHQEWMRNTGDDALSHHSEFAFNYITSSMNFANEFSGSWPPPVHLAYNSALPLVAPLQYGRDNQQSLCSTPYLYMSSGLEQNQVVCYTDTIPSLALHAMLPNINVNKNSGMPDATRRYNAEYSSVAAPFFKVPKRRAINVESESDGFVRTNTNQEKEMDQTTANQSVQSEREPALHDNQGQQTKVQSSASSVASSSVAQQQCRKSRPKRALSAYNLFFKEQREQILEHRRLLHAQFDSSASKLDKKLQSYPEHSHDKIGFEEMGKIIGQKWQNLDRDLRRRYEARAQAEKRRYKEELAKYLVYKRNEREAKFASLQASVSEDTKHRYFSSEK